MQSRKESFIRRALVVLAIFAFALTITSAAVAQDELPAPRTEIFVGYSYLHPGSDSTLTVGPDPLDPAFPRGITKGFNAAVTWNFSKYVGLTFDTSGHYHDNADVGNFAFGPTIMFPIGHVTPFAHTLFGIQRVSPSGFETDTDFLALLGGGLDLRFNRLISWRLLQADWVRSQHSFVLGTQDSFRGARLSSGIVFNLGSLTPPTPPSATCSASPSQVMEGEPVTVTATPSNFNPKHDLGYQWTTTGGKASGTGATAQIDTNGLAGGSYSATANISDTKNSKMTASCSANFTVTDKPKNPPQISCSANPTTVQSGQPSTISCTCTSPDNAQLQPLAWQSSSGKIAGEGMNGTLDTSGAGAGAINITTTCTDARGLSASASTSVNVEAPQAPPAASKINECSFPNKAKPARVDNTCKAALDDVALRLQREADAKAVIVGQMDAGEKPKNVAAQRAFNTRDYLVNEKQIDASRFETRTGQDGGNRVEIYLVPAGANFDEANTTVVTGAAAAPAKKGGPKKATTKKPAQ